MPFWAKDTNESAAAGFPIAAALTTVMIAATTSLNSLKSYHDPVVAFLDSYSIITLPYYILKRITN